MYISPVSQGTTKGENWRKEIFPSSTIAFQKKEQKNPGKDFPLRPNSLFLMLPQ